MRGKARYRITWSKGFDAAVRRIADKYGIPMEKLIHESVALYGALANMSATGSKFVIVAPDGTKEEFLWDRGQEAPEEDSITLMEGEVAQ